MDVPCQAIYITQPFSVDQIQVSKSVKTVVYRFITKRPVAPKSMSTRYLTKYALIVASLLDLFCV